MPGSCEIHDDLRVGLVLLYTRPGRSCSQRTLGKKSSKVISIVTFYSKYNGALTFENLSDAYCSVVDQDYGGRGKSTLNVG